MKVLVLRFDAPLVSFGAPAIDAHGFVQRFPALSMLTGMCANALGWDHRDWRGLDRLQARMQYAARIDRQGSSLVDYQTVDLSQPSLTAEVAGWTTRGAIAQRGGGQENASGTHQRRRHYRADSIHTVVVTLTGDETPSVDDLERALVEPSRPLFLGRRTCIPAAPILLATIEATSLVSALETVPRCERGDAGPLPASWPSNEASPGGTRGGREVATSDERDWRSRVHVGRRLVREGHVNPPEDANG